ncbi:alpha/beta hydrolase [Enterococcus sp. AZ051]|uniref:alpha/beta hydrolase n=1 Tax=Enterococcus sp. AZ051 TaxID=2774698 RepID=UPI003D26EE6D
MTFGELPKKWKVQIILLSALSLLFLFMFASFKILLETYRETNQVQRSELMKPDDQLIGERLLIDRPRKNPVKVNIYRPKGVSETSLSLIVNVHGGGFVGGDADALDTQSQRIADKWRKVVVTVNYTKADVRPISYGAEEIKDTVLYFAKEKTSYGVDPAKIFIIGYSAGAHYAALSAELLSKEKFGLAGLVMAYPWTTGLSVEKQEKSFPPTLFVLAGQDPISQKAKPFIEKMRKAGRTVEVIDYPEAVHSFIESNNPEGLTGANSDMSDIVNSAQEILARKSEKEMLNWVNNQ